MYIRNLKLKNIACFEDAKLSFVDENDNIIKWTVLLGENGTGKSMILRTIALLLGGSNVARELQLEPRLMVRFGSSEATAQAVVEVQQQEEEHDRMSHWVRKNLNISLRFLDEPFSRGWGEISDDDQERFKGHLSDYSKIVEGKERKYYDLREGYFVCGYGASRITPRGESSHRRLSDKRRDPRFERLQTLFTEEVLLAPIDEWLSIMEYEFLKMKDRYKSVGKTRFKSAVEALSILLPSVKFSEIDSNGTVIFSTPYGEVPLSELSRGYRDVLTWVSDLMRRLIDAFPLSKDPLHEEGVVLVEEIALHLHPIWQQKVIDFLRKRFPNIQFIATTHSPLATQSLQRNEFVKLERMRRRRGRKDIVSIDRYNFAPKGLSADQALTSPMFGLESAKSQDLKKKMREFNVLKKAITQGKATEKKKRRYRKLVSALGQVQEAPGETFEQRNILLEMEKILKKLGREDLLERPTIDKLMKKRKPPTRRKKDSEGAKQK